MTYEELLSEIRTVSQLVTEENSDGKLLYNIKKKIKKYVTSVSDIKLKETLPNILNHIIKYFSSKNTKYILTFLVTILMTVGISLADVKDVYIENNADNYIEWTKYEEDNQQYMEIEQTFEIGEYKADVTKFVDFFKSKLNKGDTVTIEGDVIVSISYEDNGKSNYANDDTPKDKENGGKLIEKRLKYSKIFIKNVEKELKNQGYNVKFVVKFDSFGKNKRYLKLEFINIIHETTQKSKINKNNTYIDQGIDNIENSDATITGGNDNIKDIKTLSKNYQYVELLKLGGIETDRVQGDKRTNLYTEWI